MGESETENKKAVPKGKADAWKSAANWLAAVGYIPSSFTVCIRQLTASQRASNGSAPKLDSTCEYLVRRFLNSPTITAHVYFLSTTFRSDVVASKPVLEAGDFLSFYTPAEWASILSLIFITHKVKSLCDDQEWDTYGRIIQGSTDIGGILGTAVPAFSFSDGILVGGLRWLVLGFCAAKALRQFQTYRRNVLKEGTYLDPEAENKYWGCTHAQLSTLLLLNMGFPSTYTVDYEAGLSASIKDKLNPTANKFRILARWTHALQTSSPLPSISGENEFGASDQGMDQIIRDCGKIAQRGSEQNWLLKKADDVTPEQAERIAGFEDAKRITSEQRKRRRAAPAVQAEKDDDFNIPKNEIPEHIRRHFPEGEFEDLKAQVKELLNGE